MNETLYSNIPIAGVNGLKTTFFSYDWDFNQPCKYRGDSSCGEGDSGLYSVTR